MTNQVRIVMGCILIISVGLLVLNPSIIINVQAQMYNEGYQYDNHQKKSSNVNVQKINCGNSNINVNGIDVTQIPTDNLATAETANEGVDAIAAQNGNGWGDRINFNKNLVNICINVNDNEQVKVSPPEEEETCEDCFSVLTEIQKNRLLNLVEASSIPAYCERLLDTPNSCQENSSVISALGSVPEITPDHISDIVQCLIDKGVIMQECD